MLKKSVLVLVVFLFSFNFVSGWYVFHSCGGGSPLVFTQGGEDYNYCIKDSDCTQDFQISFELGGMTLYSGIGMGHPLAPFPIYSFGAVDICTTPMGCTDPVYIDNTDPDVTITIPADAYPDGPVYIGTGEYSCGGGDAEWFGFYWNNLNPFGAMSSVDEYCYAGEDCIVEIIAYNRLFYGNIAVRGTHESSGESWDIEHTGEEQPASILVGEDDGSGRIMFTIPENTFEAGNVDLEIFDLINRISIPDQSGGYTTLTFIESPSEDPLQIDVIPDTCPNFMPCNVDITVLNVPIDMDNQHFELSGTWGEISYDLTDSGVITQGNHVEFTIDEGTFGEEQVTLLYYDNLLGQQDTEIINMVSESFVCDPTGCDGVCPSGCTVGDDTDCGCVDNNGCCGLGCSYDNDNDCSEICAPTGCDGDCPDGCTIHDDPDCGCRDGDSCCGFGCTIDKDAACSIPPNCRVAPGSIDVGEVCDAGTDLTFGNDNDDVGSKTCLDFNSDWDLGYLACKVGCVNFDKTHCDSSSNTDPEPVVGLDEYIVNGLCLPSASDPDGVYGERNWTIYGSNGQPTGETGSSSCVLDIEDIPLFGFFSVLIFVLVLGIFYYRKKVI
ncbi:hypothetical protein K8R33_01530 [archaeon]|nr:hypothetical protein [archaeon]